MALRKPTLKFTKDHLYMFLVSIFVFAVFGLYLLFVGIPMTEARNYYNRGVAYYEINNYDRAEQLFQMSLDIWYTDEADDYLKLTKQQLQEKSSL